MVFFRQKYEPYLCNGCHDLMQRPMNFNDVAVVSIKGNNYGIHFWYMSKDGAISITENSNLNAILLKEKLGCYNFFIVYENV